MQEIVSLFWLVAWAVVAIAAIVAIAGVLMARDRRKRRQVERHLGFRRGELRDDDWRQIKRRD